jgi:hypothetical protein
MLMLQALLLATNSAVKVMARYYKSKTRRAHCYRAHRVDVPADLAVAFILSRPLRRVRLPLELAVASVLARAAPALTRIHVMHIFRAFPGYQEPDWMKDGVQLHLFEES